jgi:hypothetical protein
MAASRCECTGRWATPVRPNGWPGPRAAVTNRWDLGTWTWSAPLSRVRASTSPGCKALRRSPRTVPPESGRPQRCTSTYPMRCWCTSGTPTTHRAVEDCKRRPVAADSLSLDGAGGIGWKVHAVVLVGLVDRAGGCDTHEVHWDVQATRGEVGEPMCRRFGRHRICVAQILVSDVFGSFGLTQEGQRARSGMSCAAAVLATDQHPAARSEG